MKDVLQADEKAVENNEENENGDALAVTEEGELIASMEKGSEEES